tara:strand:- start:994 stop:1629 length:636 start_codon:yes stop_codon:yes gene_type:complete
MSKLNISIFGNKIFFEIINEINLLSNCKIKYYEDINLCIKEAKHNTLLVYFINKKHKIDFNQKITNEIPCIIIGDSSIPQSKFYNNTTEQIKMPFSILEFEKKIIFLIAKSEFKKNSIIKLEDYVIDKNERKIRKDGHELQLSEKEVNFLVLFSKIKEPISKNFVLKNVWHYSSESETHTVETHIHRLRKKILEKFNDKNFIKSNKKGYYI